ncbi:MAG: type II toxin-antitoxin system HicB family antitoxin [Bacteroidetes bacterium]|nr:type II toxin-antitoxin system HicB family antitoxin [Bacteroidota bacterium]
MPLKLKITMVFKEIPHGGFVGFVEEIPGVNTQGNTIRETKANLIDALKLTLDFHRERAEKITGKKRKGITKEAYEFIAA